MAQERTHSVKIAGYRGTPEELGRDIVKQRYDFAIAVFYGMALEIYSQMQNDAERGRKTLAGLLYTVYIGLSAVRKSLQIVWCICRPHMARELKKTPEIKDGQIHGY